MRFIIINVVQYIHSDILIEIYVSENFGKFLHGIYLYFSRDFTIAKLIIKL